METSKQFEFKTSYHCPKKIVAEEQCLNSCLMLEERPRQAVLLKEQPCLIIKKGGWIVLDFGTELQGGIMITLPQLSDNTHIRIVFGESVSEAMSYIGYKNSTNDHSIRDVILPVTSWQTFRYGNTGFRFVKLSAVDNDIAISGVQAVFERRDLEYIGSFECNDEKLNNIWRTGAYTVHLNTQEYIWDGIKRDRLIWIGDMHPEVMTILSVFGELGVIRETLDFIMNITSSREWMNGMPSYTIWWLEIIYDLYFWSGDTEYLFKNKDYIANVCDHLVSQINEDGTHNIENMFVDWSAHETEYEKAGFQALLAIGMKNAARLCEILELYELEQACKKAEMLVKRHIYPYKGNKQIAAMQALAEIVDSEFISNDVIIPGGERGLSSFWGYYTLLALGKCNKMVEALTIIRNYWGKMIELGATTFWEFFDVDWADNAARIDEVVPNGKIDVHAEFGKNCYTGLRRSLCHGWAGGPTAFLSQEVLGISIKEAGCKKIEIRPRLGDLLWVKGTFPTPYGPVRVEHAVIDKKINTKVTAPEEIKIEIFED